MAFFLLSLAYGQHVVEKYHRAKIHYSDRETLLQLDRMGVAVDHGFHKKGHFIISDFSESELAAARSLGVQVEIEIEDLQKVYKDQNNQLQLKSLKNTCGDMVSDYPTPTGYSSGSMSGYQTYGEVLQHLDDMRTAYPNLITACADIGNYKTYENRSIEWVKITKNAGTPNNRPQVLYTALHHAREPNSMSQLLFFMWYLLENYDTDDDIKLLVDNTELYFVPVVNPDGYVYVETDLWWRKNRRPVGNGAYGVDLNRNYDYCTSGTSGCVWNTTGTSGPWGETYPGTVPFSEPETQAIRYLVENNSFTVALNNHTHSELLLYPYGYEDNKPTPDDAVYQAISAAMVSESGYINQISADLYPASGDSDDFMYGHTLNHDKIFAFTPEIGYAFWPNQADIIPINKEMMHTNLTAARLAGDYGDITETSPTYIGGQASFDIDFELTRYGLGGNGDFTVSLVPVSGNIASTGTAVNFQQVDLLDTEAGSFAVTLDGGVSSGDEVLLDLAVDNGGYTYKKRLVKYFGEVDTILEDNGADIDEYFTNNGWFETTETYVSAPGCYTNAPNGQYQNDAWQTLTLTEPVDLTGMATAYISFYAKWDIEKSWDYVQVQVSTDSGASWTALCGKYTGTGSGNASQPAGEPIYDGTQSDWVPEEMSLDDYLGEQVLIRFVFGSDGGVTGDGFYFDDFKANLLEADGVSTDMPKTFAIGIYPNPSDGIFHITNPEAKTLDYRVYNIAGQVVSKGELSTENTRIDLSFAGAGVFFVRFTDTESGAGLTRRVVISL